MHITALYLVFTFYFLLSPVVYAVPADANIINRIRDLKASKQDQLSNAIENTRRELMLSSRARVLTKHELEKYERDRLEKYRNPGTGDSQKNKNPRKKDVLVFHYKKEKQDKLDELQSSLKTMRSRLDRIDANDLNSIVDSFRAPFHVGQFGRVGSASVDVRGPVSGKYWHSLEIQQRMYIIGIINDHESIVGYVFGYGEGRGTPDLTKTFWLKGVSTAGLVDRSSINPPPFLMITGTKDYETVLGAKQTVFVMEPLELPSNF
jgi:hypothetical protein